MIICPNCKKEGLSEYEVRCPKCGFDIRKFMQNQFSSSTCSQIDSESVEIRRERILSEICRKYISSDAHNIIGENAINTDRKYLSSVIRHYPIPMRTGIFAVYDDTVFHSAKVGFVVTTSGVYFEKEEYLPWTAFIEEKIVRVEGQHCMIGNHPYSYVSDAMYNFIVLSQSKVAVLYGKIPPSDTSDSKEGNIGQEYISVRCPSCGGLNKLKNHQAAQCSFCGKIIQG